jgi:hypothetical protein
LWHYQAKDGISIKAALDFLLPFYQDKKWPHEQIAPIETTYERLIPLLKRAAKVYQKKKYAEVLMRLPVDSTRQRVTLLYVE